MQVVISYNNLSSAIRLGDKLYWCNWKYKSKMKNWIRRKVLDLCTKLGWLKNELETVTALTSRIETTTIENLITDQMAYLMRQGLRPAKVVIGTSTFYDLRDELATRYRYFDMPLRMKNSNYYMGNLKVHMVPYINGAVVIPEYR